MNSIPGIFILLILSFTFVFKHRPFDDAQFERRGRHAISLDPERQAYVATAEDNIWAKLEWYRMGGETLDRQWNDVQGVLKTHSVGLISTIFVTGQLRSA